MVSFWARWDLHPNSLSELGAGIARDKYHYTCIGAGGLHLCSRKCHTGKGLEEACAPSTVLRTVPLAPLRGGGARRDRRAPSTVLRMVPLTPLCGGGARRDRAAADPHP